MVPIDRYLPLSSATSVVSFDSSRSLQKIYRPEDGALDGVDQQSLLDVVRYMSFFLTETMAGSSLSCIFLCRDHSRR